MTASWHVVAKLLNVSRMSKVDYQNKVLPKHQSRCTVWQEYLQQFYHLKMCSHSKRHADLMKEKIRAMQHFFDLKESGLLDQKTQDVMREARCGELQLFSWTAQMEEQHHHIQVRQNVSTDRWILQSFHPNLYQYFFNKWIILQVCLGL